MGRIFAPSILFAAVKARGTGDGSSVQNAAEVELIPGRLKLWTYNENIAGIDTLRGNLWFGRTANFDDYKFEYRRYVEYGACFRQITSQTDIDAKWDCM